MKIYFRGKNYTTLTSCYQDNIDIATVGIATIRNRLKQGFSLEEAFTKPKEVPNTSKLGSHIVEDIEYENLPSIAKAYNMTTDAVYKRYSRGFRGNDLVPPKKRKSFVESKIEPNDLRTTIEVNGIKYRSAMKACEQLGVKYITFRRRLERGLTIEQCLGIESIIDKRVGEKKRYSIDGELFTIEELSKNYKVPISTIRYRLQRNATVEQALGIEKINEGDLITQSQYKTQSAKRPRRKKVKLEVDGKTYKTYKELADAFSIPYYVVRQRILDYGYTPTEAVTSQGKGQKVVVEGIEYKSKAEAAEAHGISLPILLGRMNGGLTLEQALGLEDYDTANTIFFEDKKYKNLSHLAEEKNISITTLRSRLSRMDLKEAIEAGEKIINKGRYNLTILQRDSELANSEAELYFIQFIYQENLYYKVGITVKNVDERIKGEGFQYTVIKTYNDKLLNVFTLEQEILALVSDKKADFSADILDGYSEVFNLEIDEVEIIESLIDEYLPSCK